MKTNSRFARALTALHVAAALALASPTAFGQANAQNTESDSQASRAFSDRNRVLRQIAEVDKQKAVSAAASPSLFEIEITDGNFMWKGKKQEATLENVVDLLRERHDGANIVLSPGLPRIRIMNLKLRATSLQQELEALRVASGNKFVWNDNFNSPVLDPTTGLPVARKDDKTPLFILSENPAAMAGLGRQVEVFNLTDYFNSFGDTDEDSRAKRVDESLQQIENIVTQTLRTVEEDLYPVIGFQFHRGANLLVVSGSPDALEVARKVVSALGPQSRPVAGGGFPGTPTDPWGNPYRMTPVPGNAPSAASNKARRAIMSKLESIRLDSVGPWNLSLGEIVKLLNDEAKKRDADKRGINFLVNPNPPPSMVQSAPGMSVAMDPTTGLPVPSAPAAPAEVTDINSVQIKIDLPLTNVRMVDVLDAIVKVADHPIRYTISDYAVVFSLRGPDTPLSEETFPGGSPGFTAPLP